MTVKRLSRFVGLFCLASQGLFAACAPVAAEAPAAAEARADLGRLVALIDDARSGFQPVTADNVARAKANVRERLTEVGRAVGIGTTWRDYLMWDAQLQEFDRDEPGSAQLWRLVYARVARDTDPLEWDEFQDYRGALQSLIRRIEAHNNPALEADFQAVLTELATLLSRSENRLPAGDAARVSELLTKLNRQQQAPKLVAAIRKLATGPNLIMEIPAAVLAENEPIKENFAIRQVVRGSRVEGNGTLRADQSFSLAAGEESIVVQTVVKGTSNSTTVGYGSGATVRSSGSLKFESAANVSVNMAGVKASGFDTTGTLATSILGISVDYRRPRAASRARQAVYDRQEADRRAAQSQALADLDTTFDARLEALIAPLQTAYRQNVYLPLVRHHRLPKKSNFVSGGKRATMQVWLADEAQLAAPGAPPWPKNTGKQVRIAIHESAVNNTSALLEGRVRSLVNVLKGRVFTYIAESAKPSERLDIRFHEEAAIRGTLRDGTLEIRLVGTSYVIDGSTYPGMEVTLRYHLDNDASKVLRLSEPPQVVSHVPSGGERPRLGLRGIALRRILSNVLQENVPDTIDLTEIELSESFAGLGKLQTQRIEIRDGWFIIEAIPSLVAEVN